MSRNPQKNVAVTSFITAVIMTIMIFVPYLADIDPYNGGFAISLVSILIAVTAAIVGLMFIGQAKKVDQILRGQGVLAHWIYPVDLWREYAEKEYKTEKAQKKFLVIIVAAFAIFFGLLFWLLDPEPGFIVFLVMMGLIGLIILTWQFTAWYNYRKNTSNTTKQVYIRKDAVYLNNTLYEWATAFTSFNKVKLQKNKDLNLLVFIFTSLNRTGPQTYTIRVPIPPGKEENAKNIAEQINESN
ncbi:MAG: hypothetical protein PHY74_07675 [Candidatus Bathyarchaeota archaeon]|nr:hypothetical protein [Candidatus Bathyarchaeota archaeon]MDT8781979.1 hypothetical protein [Candidatus Bathyarchaeota archaeon]